MTRVVDAGGVFEATLDTVWAFVADPEAHGGAHRHEDPVRVRESEQVGRYSWTQPFDGRPERFTMHWHAYPPLGIAYEVLEGPFMGSTFFLSYTPEGPRTGVTIVGEFVSPTIAPDRVEAAVRGFFAVEFDQDAAGLRAFVAAPRRPSASSAPRA